MFLKEFRFLQDRMRDSIGNRFKRSWEITKKTFHVMKQDKEILLFPILSAITSLILLVALIFPYVLSLLVVGEGAGNLGMVYIAVFAFYFIAAFTSTFFNVATVHIASTRFSGGDATFMDGLKMAFKRFKQIIMWSLLTATVGLVLNILQAQARKKGGIFGIIGKILVSLMGFAWAIVSLFVVPAIAIKGEGPIQALKSSIKTVRKTWGESLIKYYGLGFAKGIFIFVGTLLLIVPGIFSLVQGGFVSGVVLISLYVVYLVIVLVMFSSANTIFDTALFIYAEQGKIPHGYTKEELDKAFISTRNSS
jgi:hypothetical protein